MVRVFLRKLKNRLSKSNNRLFKNYLYKLNRDEAREVQSKLPVCQEPITQDNYKRVIEVINLESYKESFKKMLDQGQIGIFAIYNNRAVGYNWAYIGRVYNKISKKRADDLIKLKNDKALIHFCRTAEDYKGNKIYPFLLSKLSKILFSKYNIKNIYIDTDIENIPSQKGIEKAGFRKIYLVKRLKLLGFFISWNFRKI